ncbi:hypothetical protein Ptc2401_00789 [Prosthecochloris sp. CIB 2401]|nr:hypothetical protein Ptc2401_00789 [Prosthecochloris sp. CIB 2401]
MGCGVEHGHLLLVESEIDIDKLEGEVVAFDFFVAEPADLGFTFEGGFADGLVLIGGEADDLVERFLAAIEAFEFELLAGNAACAVDHAEVFAAVGFEDDHVADLEGCAGGILEELLAAAFELYLVQGGVCVFFFGRTVDLFYFIMELF